MSDKVVFGACMADGRCLIHTAMGRVLGECIGTNVLKYSKNIY